MSYRIRSVPEIEWHHFDSLYLIPLSTLSLHLEHPKCSLPANLWTSHANNFNVKQVLKRTREEH